MRERRGGRGFREREAGWIQVSRRQGCVCRMPARGRSAPSREKGPKDRRAVDAAEFLDVEQEFEVSCLTAGFPMREEARHLLRHSRVRS